LSRVSRTCTRSWMGWRSCWWGRLFFFSSRRRHTRTKRDWSSDVCSSDLEELFAIPGSPPDMLNPPKGDAFAPRNEFALEIDKVMEPPMFKVSDTHYAATWLLHEDAPDIKPPESVKRRMQGISNTGSKDGKEK